MWECWLVLAQDESAVSAVEYAILLSIIGAGLFAAVLGLGMQIATEYDTAAATLQLQ